MDEQKSEQVTTESGVVPVSNEIETNATAQTPVANAKVANPAATQQPQNVQRSQAAPQLNAKDQLQEILKSLDICFADGEIIITFGRNLVLFKDVVANMRDHFRLMGEDKVIVVNSKFIKNVKETVGFMKAVVLEVPLTRSMGSFLRSYCTLASNWNNNVTRDATIDTDLQFLIRFTKQHFTTLELLDLTKNLLNKLKNLSRFALPSIELSDHYAKSMDEKTGGANNPVEGTK